jgi:DNA-nicking Smr family endonuclease
MAKSLPTLDLHGRTTDEVFPLLDQFLRRHAHLKAVRVMPGKGHGKVRAKVEEYLRLAHYHWSVERLGNGKPNEGVLVVHMD